MIEMTPKIHFSVNKYCEIFINLLVEDIKFCYHPILSHYGKCTVIGRLSFENGTFYLESLRIPHLL